MLGPDEEPLDGGWQTEVARSGDVVYRSPKPQSATVHRLLDHLHVRGFDAAPRSLGFAADGREQLGFVEGTGPHPRAWTDEAVTDHRLGSR